MIFEWFVGISMGPTTEKKQRQVRQRLWIQMQLCNALQRVWPHRDDVFRSSAFERLLFSSIHSIRQLSLLAGVHIFSFPSTRVSSLRRGLRHLFSSCMNTLLTMSFSYVPLRAFV